MDAAAVARELADELARAKVDRIFGMPGGGANLEVVKAARDVGIDFVLAHSETAATLMAAAFADLRGTPGVALVTRGPGVASALNGVANAFLDRQPVLLVADAVLEADRGRIAHQLLDQRRLLEPITVARGVLGGTWAGLTVRAAVVAATAEAGGPVYLEFDPTAESRFESDADEPEGPPPEADVAKFVELVAGARRAVVVLGAEARRHADAMRSMLRNVDVPALMTYRAKGVLPDSWPNAAGLMTGGVSERDLLAAADLIVLAGVDSTELIPGSWPFDAPVVRWAAVPEPAAYYRCDVDVRLPLNQLASRCVLTATGGDWVAEAGRRYAEREDELLAGRAVPEAGAVLPQDVVRRARALAPARAIATVDAGAHMLVAMPLWKTESEDEVLISSGLATMGYALPAAVGAALALPGRRILTFVGDGGIGMGLGDLETVARLRAPITVVVFDDAQLSLIRVKVSPGVAGVEDVLGFAGTDFAAIARAFDIPAETLWTIESLDRELAASFERSGPTLLDVRVDPSAYPEVMATLRGPRAPSDFVARSLLR
ncbi:MAG TPA: thiamine pyrophosphate-dependent enzyme [Nocardioides sp.]|jgi:acetolactate synthase-1/2/3 large subunit|uniref:thiamine pyrophosphate-dependent enzyme n=1 Tax=Nocardioides sp. TaxID=35761 RepID=UPI002E3514E7|nr:thiamine pyrophosphate-dependent enzyme [Nocardioides sp.]HEX3931806.1 thiamine pyrophosphate-dependent enzyme [Nocardioides sp.]